jgi:uncharacterized membrane protein (UPF0127 family)
MPARRSFRFRTVAAERAFAPCTARFTGGEIRPVRAQSFMGQVAHARFRGLETVAVLGREVPVASTPRSRLLGLAWLDRSSAGPGLLLTPCRSVHTFAMRFDLDLVFLDSTGRPLRVVCGVGPRRMLWQPGARAVLEAPSAVDVAVIDARTRNARGGRRANGCPTGRTGAGGEPGSPAT